MIKNGIIESSVGVKGPQIPSHWTSAVPQKYKRNAISGECKCNFLPLISRTISFNLLLILISKNVNPQFQTDCLKKNRKTSQPRLICSKWGKMLLRRKLYRWNRTTRYNKRREEHCHIGKNSEPAKHLYQFLEHRFTGRFLEEFRIKQDKEKFTKHIT